MVKASEACNKMNAVVFEFLMALAMGWEAFIDNADQMASHRGRIISSRRTLIY